MRTLPPRVADKILIEPNSGCWLWLGNLNHDGYGRVTIKYAPWRVHRFVYQALVGPIPEGKELDHLCRTPSCCNPLHLEAVPRIENIKRGLNWPIAGQAFQRNKTHCSRGHAFDEENTYVYRGSRTCRKCRVLRVQKCYNKNKR